MQVCMWAIALDGCRDPHDVPAAARDAVLDETCELTDDTANMCLLLHEAQMAGGASALIGARGAAGWHSAWQMPTGTCAAWRRRR